MHFFSCFVLLLRKEFQFLCISLQNIPLCHYSIRIHTRCPPGRRKSCLGHLIPTTASHQCCLLREVVSVYRGHQNSITKAGTFVPSSCLLPISCWRQWMLARQDLRAKDSHFCIIALPLLLSPVWSQQVARAFIQLELKVPRAATALNSNQ